jgi:hypothetical protein
MTKMEGGCIITRVRPKDLECGMTFRLVPNAQSCEQMPEGYKKRL